MLFVITQVVREVSLLDCHNHRSLFHCFKCSSVFETPAQEIDIGRYFALCPCRSKCMRRDASVFWKVMKTFALSLHICFWLP